MELCVFISIPKNGPERWLARWLNHLSPWPYQLSVSLFNPPPLSCNTSSFNYLYPPSLPTPYTLPLSHIKQLNEDLIGEIHFLSQTGPFSIPVKCLMKQCLISVEEREVDFGRVCIGETVTRRIILCNNGALPTKFQFAGVPSSKPAIQVCTIILLCCCPCSGT